MSAIGCIKSIKRRGSPSSTAMLLSEGEHTPSKRACCKITLFMAKKLKYLFHFIQINLPHRSNIQFRGIVDGCHPTDVSIIEWLNRYLACCV